MTDMKDENATQVASVTPVPARTDPAENCSALSVGARLRLALGGHGAITAVSKRSGVPMRNLTRFLSGQDIKSADLVALADATGVRIEWLASGRGPMRQPAQESIPSAPATAPEPRSFTPPNVEHLAEAIRRAERLYEEKNRTPSPRIYAQILLLLCDEIAAAEKHVDISQPD